MKKTLLFILSIIIGVALFIGVISYIGVEELKQAFYSFSWQVIAVVVALGFMQMLITIYRWQIVLKAQGDIVPFRKLLGPKFVGYTVSFLTPGLYVGGEPVRAYLLKREAGVKLSHGFASIIVDKILDFTYPLPFLIGALIYAMLKYDISWEVFGVFIFILVCLIILLGLFYVQTYRGKGFFSSLIVLFRLNRIPRIGRLVNKMLYFEKLILVFFNKKRALFVQGLLISLLGGTMIFIQFAVLLHSLGISVDIIQVLVMMVFMILSFMAPIPASLGSLEAGQVIVFNALRHPASVGVAFVLILRIVEIFKLTVGFLFLSNIGLKFLRNIPRNNHNNHSKSD